MKFSLIVLFALIGSISNAQDSGIFRPAPSEPQATASEQEARVIKDFADKVSEKSFGEIIEALYIADRIITLMEGRFVSPSDQSLVLHYAKMKDRLRTTVASVLSETSPYSNKEFCEHSPASSFRAIQGLEAQSRAAADEAARSLINMGSKLKK